jgi:hypothetical protein
MNLKDALLKELENDPFNLLVFKPKVSTHRDIPKMVVEAFNEINEFYEAHSREPQKENDRNERTLCAKLDGIRADKNQITVLKELDRFKLLDNNQDILKHDINLDEINDLDDDPFGLLNDDVNDIFTLKNVTVEKDMPDYIAKRKPCKNFIKYESLFKTLQKELQNGERKIVEYKGERYIQKGLFFVLKGVVGYVEDIGKITKQKNVENARLHCIFENGTESNMLLRSLSAELYKDGKIISFLNEEIEDNLSQVNDEDKLNGYIYILKSLSEDEIIRNIDDLYKIGYSTVAVDERIKNAKNESTYLMADVLKVASYKCFNMNTQKFEQLLHQFFGNSCLNINIIGKDKQNHTPREWFIAPLNVIKQAVVLLINGEIIYYKYDSKMMEIVKK